VPTFRADLEAIPTYTPGRPIDEVARELGLSDVAKLASNECPTEPFPEVIEAIARAGHAANRYPENSGYHLVRGLAALHGVPEDHFWLGLGSTQLLLSIALAVGGSDTSAVFADPSFVMYPIASRISGAREVTVPLDAEMCHDLGAMLDAIADDTTIVYVCNPNNPTATYRSGDAVAAFFAAVPERVTVVVDEAYHEYVTAPDHRSMLPLVTDHDNLVVTRTFSKAYGLAGLRIGYAAAHPDTLVNLRRTQIPFSANNVAQAAAIEALSHQDLVAARAKDNAVGRERIEGALAALGMEYWPSQTNFVLFRPGTDTGALGDALLRQGVIVRPAGPFIRVSVGTERENELFAAALEQALS